MDHFTEMCSGSEAGSFLWLIDSCITLLKAQEPSGTCNESKAEEERGSGVVLELSHLLSLPPPKNMNPILSTLKSEL